MFLMEKVLAETPTGDGAHNEVRRLLALSVLCLIATDEAPFAAAAAAAAAASGDAGAAAAAGGRKVQGVMEHGAAQAGPSGDAGTRRAVQLLEAADITSLVERILHDACRWVGSSGWLVPGMVGLLGVRSSGMAVQCTAALPTALACSWSRLLCNQLAPHTLPSTCVEPPLQGGPLHHLFLHLGLALHAGARGPGGAVPGALRRHGPPSRGAQGGRCCY